MSKKTLWILVSVLALALIGTISIVGVNQWQTNRAEAEAEAHKQQRAEMDAKIASQAKLDAEQEAANRDSAFVASMQASVAGLDESNPEGTVELGRGICEAISEGDNASTVAYWLTKSEDSTPYTDVESANAVSISVSTYCPERGPITSDEIITSLVETAAATQLQEEEDARARNLKLAEEQSTDPAAIALKTERFLKAVRDGVPYYKPLPDALLVNIGQSVCASLKDGAALEEIILTFVDGGRTMPEAKMIAAFSMGAFCYEETEKLPN